MTRIIRWNPLREMVDMQRQLDRVFDEMNTNFAQGDLTQTGNWLAFDIHENEDNYIVQADLPGFNSDDINITLHENTLTVSAENKREELSEGERQVISERRYGRFQRSIRLPETVDSERVEANFDNGVLTLEIAKSEVTKPRQIPVNSQKMLTNEN
ncbi:MAG: Hsp20/alpha crystallin family protein [Phototrophicaceae bacterium]